MMTFERRARFGRPAGRCAVIFLSVVTFAVGLSAGWFVLAPTAQAQVERVEAVGVYGIREDRRATVVARDEAVDEGIRQGVTEVARDLIDGAESDPETIRDALGSDVLPYTRSFRILEDRGERAARRARAPGVQREYVVLVEAIVDVDRVKGALAAKGLLAGSGLIRDQGEPVLVELVGIVRFPAFEAIRKALRSKLGARRVDTLGFARNRQLLSVEGPFGPMDVYSSLASLEAAGVTLDPVGVDEEGRRVRFEGTETP